MNPRHVIDPGIQFCDSLLSDLREAPFVGKLEGVHPLFDRIVFCTAGCWRCDTGEEKGSLQGIKYAFQEGLKFDLSDILKHERIVIVVSWFFVIAICNRRREHALEQG